MTAWDDMHIGRSFSGTLIEDNCPCEKAACGLVAKRHPDCEQHAHSHTIRQAHRAQDCPGCRDED